MELKEIRKEIDKLDDELLQVFEKRMNLSKLVAQTKQEKGLPVFDSSREREILCNITSKASREISNYAGALYNTVFSLSRSYQKKIINQDSEIKKRIEEVTSKTPVMMPEKAIVACQGMEGAYSQHACDKLFRYPSVMYFNTFEDVFKAVESGLCKYGVLPLENSTAGSVNSVYDLMSKYKFYIVRSAKLCIQHSLLAKKGTKFENIKEIFSHEQAINQCSLFLNSLDSIKITPCENTAKAAKLVSKSERNDVAAIGADDCAELYDLSVLSRDIQNTQNNYTRFICISKNLEIYPGADRTSIVMTISHKPGSLYNVISRFASLGLNLTKLESRPIEGSDFEFRFYFDIGASVYSDELKSLITELENDSVEFEYLGSYSEI